MGRQVSPSLQGLWQEATDNPDALAALAASRSVYRELSGWQAVLVAEALQAGATWEQVGDALATTRQAAWARFRSTVLDAEGGPFVKEGVLARKQAYDELKVLYERARQRDAKWKERRAELEGEVRAVRERIRTLDRERGLARDELHDEIRQKRAALGEQSQAGRRF
jgi:hypothetical protein